MKYKIKSLMIIIVIISLMSCSKQVVSLGNDLYRVKPKGSLKYIITDDTCLTKQVI